MADGVKIDIVSPEYLVLSDTARSVTVPATEGYLTVLGEHAPLMTTLRAGFVTVVGNGGTAASYFVAGGFADIAGTTVTILAEEARPASEFGRAQIEAEIAAAQETLRIADGVEAKQDAQNALDQWRNLLLEHAGLGAAAH